VKVTLGTDDPHILQTTLSVEYLKACMNYKECDYFKLKEFIRNGAEYSYLPGESIFKDTTGCKYKEGYESCVHLPERSWSAEQKKLLKGSLKAQFQINLEKRIIAAENHILQMK